MAPLFGGRKQQQPPSESITPDQQQQPEGESFQLLDLGSGGGDGDSAPATTSSSMSGGGSSGSSSSGSSSWRSPARGAPVPVVADDAPLGVRLSRMGTSAFNIVLACSSLALAKQVLNPALYQARSEAAQQATDALPPWFQRQYRLRRMGAELSRGLARDTGLLLAASAAWFGVQAGARAARGGKEDELNVMTAGAVSAALLGAALVEPFKARRVGVWGAVGAAAGYFGYREQQALRAALLQRQQELEQKHLHTPPEQVGQALDPALLRQLLEKEQAARAEQLRSSLAKQGVDVPSSGGGDAGGPGAGGPGAAAAAASPPPSAGGPDAAWAGLMGAAPWLAAADAPEQQQQQHHQQQQQQQHKGERR